MSTENRGGFCRWCGAPVAPGALDCQQCGRSVAETAGEPTPGERGLPVGREASGRAPSPPRGRTPSRLPSWAIPVIVLGVVAVAGIGLGVGLHFAGSGDAAPVTTTTAASSEPASALQACISLRLEEGFAAPEAEDLCTNPEVGTPTINGEALPRFDRDSTDTAVGLTIPEINGTDFDGTPVAITRDGRAKVLIFVAHWCGVCQQEVPALMDWLPGATLPEGVDLISVSTGVRIDAPNYPPSRWLEREGWTVPVILDDAADGVGQAFGLSAYPYFVFVDAEGRVALRLVGGVPAETISSIVAGLVGA